MLEKPVRKSNGLQFSHQFSKIGPMCFKNEFKWRPRIGPRKFGTVIVPTPDIQIPETFD
jgi:hypothetical protein